MTGGSSAGTSGGLRYYDSVLRAARRPAGGGGGSSSTGDQYYVVSDAGRTVMWMFEVATPDHRRLHAYKHIVTRRYVHLDEDRSAFYYADDHRYRPIALDRILHAVLSPWWKERLAGGPPGAMAAAKRAVRRARSVAANADDGRVG